MAKLQRTDVVTFTKHVNLLSQRDPWELVMLGASLLDVALAESIDRRTTELSAKERDRFGQGVASTLSARIDTAWALGLITLRTARECHKLRELRNKMAHSITIESLEDPSLREIVSRFEYHQRETIEVDVEGMTMGESTVRDASNGYGSYDRIIDINGAVGFFVPTSTGVDFNNVETRVRHQIWSCIYATVSPMLVDWLKYKPL